MVVKESVEQPAVQIVTAVHRLDRPIRRAVESVLECDRAAAIVVAHGVNPDDLDLPNSERVTVLSCSDGLGYPGPPKNLGIAHATTPYVGLLDSDDYYQPGALDAMLQRAESENTDGVFANLALQDGPPMRLPLTWKTRQLSAADRGLYRTAPLGIFKREILQNPRYRLRDDMVTGEDMQPSLRLWTDGLRLDYLPDAPTYVVSAEGTGRVTQTRRSAAENLRAINALIDDGALASLNAATLEAAVVKILRAHILPYEGELAGPDANPEDVAQVAETTRRLHGLSPQATHVLSANDEAVLASLATGDVERIRAAASARTSSGLIDRVLPRNKRFALAKEGNVRTTASGWLYKSRKPERVNERPGSRPRLLILSYSNIRSDARVLKQIQLFEKDFEITTCGYGDAPDGVANHLRIPQEYMNLRLYGRYITLKQYRLAYWRVDAVRKSWELLQQYTKYFSAILANEIESLPVALRLDAELGVLSDLHEYYPSLHEEQEEWDRRIRPYYEWLCKRYLPLAAASTTVAEGIAHKYEELAGVLPRVVTNATPFVDIAPSPVHTPLRLVHHGAALRNRELHMLVEAVNSAEGDLEMDMYLMPNDQPYIDELTAQAEGTRVRILGGIEYERLIGCLNEYDVGFYVLPPVSTNHEYALPNKFFDFVQARLALLIGPSKEMRRIVDQYDLGIVTSDFSLQSAIQALERLTPEKVAYWKSQANEHAYSLSAQQQVKVWATLMRGIMTGKTD